MKKIISILLSVVFIITSMMIPVYAESTSNSGNSSSYAGVFETYAKLIKMPAYFEAMEEQAWENAKKYKGYDAYFDDFEIEFIKLTGVPYLWVDCPVEDAKIKYAYYDVNKDGIDELLLTADWGSNNNIEEILGIMTLIDGNPAVVCNGWERNSFNITNDGQILNYSSGGSNNWILSAFSLKNGKLSTKDILLKWDGNCSYVADGKYDAADLDEKMLDNISGQSKYRISQSEFDRIYNEKEKKILTVKGNIFDPDGIAVSMVFYDVKYTDYFYDSVKWAVRKNVTSGTSGIAFSPDQACSRSQVVTFLWRANGSPSVSRSNPFKDISKSKYYYDAVIWAVSKGITSGTGSDVFSPDQSCTRAQVVTFLWRMHGEPSVSGSNMFNDVKSGEYYYKPVLWAVKNNVTQGTGSKTFSPDQVCSRAQIVTFLYRDLG